MHHNYQTKAADLIGLTAEPPNRQIWQYAFDYSFPDTFPEHLKSPFSEVL